MFDNAPSPLRNCVFDLQKSCLVRGLHAGVGQIQGIESVLASSLELFLINESAIGFDRLDHVHRQVLVRHRMGTLDFDEQVHSYKPG